MAVSGGVTDEAEQVDDGGPRGDEGIGQVLGDGERQGPPEDSETALCFLAADMHVRRVVR
jgi:hypothetical protein